ncbi:uncharacterized protein LOC124316017 [Daphnia pulicaria]|uniref:uncharacterized protein LOC124316017 n=1 Tax=Daphnia pulicaria TaxID=35523 RepID=UPI001EEAA66B|nr:uncharacterized protein LOC124316017 [Daphnia pulicaria]
MVKCFVVGCKTGYKSNKEKVGCFKVPKDEKLLTLWQKLIPRGDKTLSSNDHVCSKHFKEEYIIKTKTILDQAYPLKIWKLTAQAVPTLNLWNNGEQDTKMRKSKSKKNIDVEQWKKTLESHYTSPQPLQLLDNNLIVVVPNTVDRLAADVEMTDPQPENDNKDSVNQPIIIEEVEQPVIEAVDNAIFDPTKAKLPSSWRWCPSCEHYQEDDPTANKITAVRFGVVNNTKVILKMITIAGEEVSYTVKGALIKPPEFLPKSIEKVEELTDLLSRFDSANICGGFKFDFEKALSPSLKKATVMEYGERRSKLCIRILQKGSTCYRCQHLNNLAAGDESLKPNKMDGLLERSQTLTNENRLLKRKLDRKERLIKVTNMKNEFIRIVAIVLFVFRN